METFIGAVGFLSFIVVVGYVLLHRDKIKAKIIKWMDKS